MILLVVPSYFILGLIILHFGTYLVVSWLMSLDFGIGRFGLVGMVGWWDSAWLVTVVTLSQSIDLENDTI